MSDAARAINRVRLRDGREFYTDEPHVLGKEMTRGTERVSQADVAEIEWTGPTEKAERERIMSRETVVLEDEQEIRRVRR